MPPVVILRLQEQLDEENNAKKQRLMTKMQLRHHIQSVVGNQMREVEEVSYPFIAYYEIEYEKGHRDVPDSCGKDWRGGGGGERRGDP